MARQERKEKNEDIKAESNTLDLGLRFALIYFAIMLGMTFVFFAAPPAHSSVEIVNTK